MLRFPQKAPEEWQLVSSQSSNRTQWFDHAGWMAPTRWSPHRWRPSGLTCHVDRRGAGLKYAQSELLEALSKSQFCFLGIMEVGKDEGSVHCMMNELYERYKAESGNLVWWNSCSWHSASSFLEPHLQQMEYFQFQTQQITPAAVGCAQLDLSVMAPACPLGGANQLT